MITKDNDIIVIDPGHKYQITSLDVKEGVDTNLYDNIVTFVKRTGPKYPGNVNTQHPNPYPGITMQKLTRMLLDRLEYVDKQKPCIENKLAHLCYKLANWLLEYRAAKHNKIFYFKSLNFAYTQPMCKLCGHTVCNHKKG